MKARIKRMIREKQAMNSNSWQSTPIHLSKTKKHVEDNSGLFPETAYYIKSRFKNHIIDAKIKSYLELLVTQNLDGKLDLVVCSVGKYLADMCNYNVINIRKRNTEVTELYIHLLNCYECWELKCARDLKDSPTVIKDIPTEKSVDDLLKMNEDMLGQ